MVNATDYPECTNHCKSRQHGDIITSAISKRGVSDTELCAFLNFTCCRCESVTDYSGRTALQVAASCGRLHLVRWLVCKRHADIDAKDRESGYTALHRSIFYGQIHVAIELIKLGASITHIDHDSLTAFDHSIQDGQKPSDGGELFYWGSNNNNLFGSVQERAVPDLLDFHKHYPEESVLKIRIEQFHIVLLTGVDSIERDWKASNIYSCGYGREGRLGLGNEGSYVVPQMVKLPKIQEKLFECCVDVDISRDHSIFLITADTYQYNVFTCGLNQYMVLGHVPPPDRLLTPKPIASFPSKNIAGVCARRYHSLAWDTRAVYAWGLNAGQFGPKSGERNNQFTVSPKAMNFGTAISIETVGASDGATVVVTNRGIYLFHEYQCKKIAPKQSKVLQVCTIGGCLDLRLLDDDDVKKHKDKELKVAVLLRSGQIFLWQESDQQLCRCVYSINRAVLAKHIFLNRNELLIVSQFGEGFKGFVRPRKMKKINYNDKTHKSHKNEASIRILESEDFIHVTLEKIPKIHRAVFIQSDLKGTDYCIIQAHPYKNFMDTEEDNYYDFLETPIFSDLKKCLQISTVDDGVTDFIFELKNGSYPAHKYILLHRCSNFNEKIGKSNESVLQVPEVDCSVFQQFLLFVYTGHCDFLHPKYLKYSCSENEEGLKNEEVTGNETKPKQDAQNSIKILRHLAKDFGCPSLLDFLKGRGCYENREKPFMFDRMLFQNLYDITLTCSDGEIKAHRCILSARMEYFENMLSKRWSGNKLTEVNLSFPKRTVELLLDFLYTDTIPPTDIDNLLKLLILADEFLVIQLKEKCELFLSKKISFKNAAEILSFAHLYKADELKRRCLEFITFNMAAFLDLGHLNDLHDELLEEISLKYLKKEKSHRVITPYSSAVSDEIILTIASKYPVPTITSGNKHLPKSDQKKRARFHKTSLSKTEKVTTPDKETILQNDTLDLKNQSQHYKIDYSSNGADTTSSTELLKRVGSITKATSIMKTEDIPINYVKLGGNDSSSSFENSFADSNDFPELCSSFGNAENLTPKSSMHKHESKRKIVRMSQKQRKKLNSESDDGQTITRVSETKKSPWKTNFDFASPISSPETTFSMNDIILNEKKQKENLVKIKNKLLVYVQKEDKAIEELNKFYNTQETFDEIIMIERVDTGAVASPSWVPKTK